MRVLFCDDEPSVLRLVQVMLEPRGHTVFVALGTESAIAIFESQIAAHHSFDLIVTDVSIPADSGFYLAGHVRGSGYDGRLAMMTGNEAEVANLARVKAEYWAKPDALRKLIDLVEGPPVSEE